MSKLDQFIPLSRLGRAVVAVLAGAAVAGVVTTVALAASTSGSPHPRASRGGRAAHSRAIEAFTGRLGNSARPAIASTGDGPIGIPAEADLLAKRDGRSFYVWEETEHERISERVGIAPHRSHRPELLCIGWTLPDGTASTGCGPAKKIAESGEVGFGRQEGRSALTVTAVLPRGVKSVKFTDSDGKSYEVEVTDDVVVVEDNNLARPPAAAVSYTLPDGRTKAYPLPTEAVEALEEDVSARK